MDSWGMRLSWFDCKCASLYVLSCSFTVRSVQGVLLSVAQF